MPRLTRSTINRLRAIVPLPAALVMAFVLAGCSSGPTAASHGSTSSTVGHSSRTTVPSKTKPATTSPPTTAPAGLATPPIEAAGVEVVISGSTAIIHFTSAAVTGSLATAAPTFTSGGSAFTFSVTGVTYTGGVVTTVGVPSALVSRVVVSSASGGVAVQVTLTKATSHYQFGIGHGQVGVSFS